ncbi:MAG: type IVB secretion system protein DotG/IcmE [Legionellales bacterium]
MANRKENIKSLFSNTRSRVIILFTSALLLFAVVVGYYKFKGISQGPLGSTSISGSPGGIQSIPGAINQTAQYAKLQEEQNVNQAAKASTTGGSAIPTIIQSRALGEGVTVVGSKGGKTGVGFEALAREEEGGTQQSLWVQTLKDGSCSKSAVDKVMNQGAVLSDLKGGCSCVQLKDIGYGLQDLSQICECNELRAAGFNARQLKDSGYNASRLQQCGFSACEERNSGFTAQEMKDGGYSDGELKGAGFSNPEIEKASGLPSGISAAQVHSAGCDEVALAKLHKSGVSASAVRRISGCSAQQLKAAGYTAGDLKEAGFSAAELKNASYTPDDLKKAGYNPRDLFNAGFSAHNLAHAGFTSPQIKAAQLELPPGIAKEDVKNAGCDVDVLKKEKEAGVSATVIKQNAGCSAQALKATGFDNEELANTGFTPEQIAAAKSVSDQDIKAAGCDSDKLKALLAAGVSAKKIKELNGCNAQALKSTGFDPKSLVDAGYTPAELLAAGFTPKQVEDAGKTVAAMIANGRTADCSIDYLKKARAAGVTALTIKQTLGCSAKALLAAGYSAKDLKNAGYTAAELKNAGFSAADLKAAGFSPKELRDAGFSAQQLKDAGLSAKDLKDAGFSADELKQLGFTPAQLKVAGYTGKELKEAGFSAKELASAGLKAADLKAAGFSADDLTNAGFTPKELKDAGYTTPESAVAGLANPNVQQQISGLPSISGQGPAPLGVTPSSTQQLQTILSKQNQQMAEQKYQQKIQQRTSEMLSAANQSIQEWKKVSSQAYTGGNEEQKNKGAEGAVLGAEEMTHKHESITSVSTLTKSTVIRTGDIVFAVMDTAVNSDEPGPILATIVSGKLKGTKLIGSFNLPSNANKMVITFNTMSVPGAEKTISISAYAIDPNTARTALSSKTNHHYMTRYGSLFASSFLQGFGNAIQTANTTVTVGGTGGGNNVTFSSGIGQSTLENAVIGLSTVGKAWGQQAQQNMSIPTTVQLYSGTGVGILFTRDVKIT